MVPFDVVTGRDYMVSQSGSVTILCESLKIEKAAGDERGLVEKEGPALSFSLPDPARS